MPSDGATAERAKNLVHGHTGEPWQTADVILLGQGFAGSAMAWWLHWSNQRVLLIDREERHTASRIAAGLITPITGSRMTKAVDFENQRAEAEYFYRRVEAATRTTLLDERPSIRLFRNNEERALFLAERYHPQEQQLQLIWGDGGEVTGFRMLTAARLRVTQYLEATRSYFKERDQYSKADVDPVKDVALTTSGVRITALRVQALRMVFCQGYQPQLNPWFPGVPDGASKGEMLRVRLRGRTEQTVTHRGVWLAPEEPQGTLEEQSTAGSDVFIAGATYDRQDLSPTTSKAGREVLLRGLAEFISESPEVLDQVSAVRAGMKQRRPLIAVHHEHQQLAILNGLGSQGALLAPTIAKQLSALLTGGKPQIAPGLSVAAKAVVSENSTAGPQKRSLTQLAHSIIRRVLRPGDTAIDATAGNGHDTLILARLVGETGKVVAIDLQASAIMATKARLNQQGMGNVKYQEGDHSLELQRMVEARITAKAIMFNLGYLPGSDRRVATTASSTVTAIGAAQRLLCPGGAMTVIAYRGHTGGLEEATAIEESVNAQATEEFSIDRINGDEENAESPVLFVWRRSG